ncbi:hypothetical protein LTR96_011321 [Exophiala xenobiotica]|nr:hypothetical protein LTR72_011105 [Exophiala xenobiotica]KAK5263254.1 hypothetical protein LTR96_011321 [Exophiala xenobiotica]KAK5284974.1 hypothetical protein LTR14_011341 [Exophiala xenobiotica]KAK5332923.1 hypothetical protein LTR98_010973 [Exophiala xenobiotica]KAK5471430.1 hypothetical protein LTR55_010848 [Exophiala xenobiotica]
MNAGPKRQREKRSCVTTACRACRKRKIRCDGLLPTCSTCSNYQSVCEYDFDNDRRRRPSVAQVDALQARVDHLQKLVKSLRAENARLLAGQRGNQQMEEPQLHFNLSGIDHDSQSRPPIFMPEIDHIPTHGSRGEDTSRLVDNVANIFSELKLTKSGEMSWFGPSSNLNLDDAATKLNGEKEEHPPQAEEIFDQHEWLSFDNFDEEIAFHNLSQQPDFDLTGDFGTGSWAGVSLEHAESTAREDLLYQAATQDHLLLLYWTWQHGFFVLISKELFVADLERARSQHTMAKRSKFYSPLLLCAILAHAAPLSRRVELRSNPDEPGTSGDQFFKRARRLLEYEMENPGITTVQALALMGSREAGCGRNGLGWLYSGMSFRMALDLGLHMSCDELVKTGQITQNEADSRLMSFWGCYAYDKSWSAYVGKPESIAAHLVEEVPWPTISVEAEQDLWEPYGEETSPTMLASEPMLAYSSSTARQIVAIQGILGSVVRNLYSTTGKGQRANYSDTVTKLHCELLAWLQKLPGPLKVRNHGFSASHLLPHVLVMHILYHTATILLFRPFISHARSNCLPESFDPLGSCTSSAVKIVTLVKAYRKDYSLQFCHNMAVHGLFTASTIHLVNLVSKNASYEHSARQSLFRSTELLKEMGSTWQSAVRCLQVIWGLMERHHVCVGQAPLTETVHSKANHTLAPDEDDYLNDTNMDYTYESRSRQQFMHSMAQMPQLVTHPNISLDCDKDELAHNPRQPLYGAPDHAWNLAPRSTLTFEAGSTPEKGGLDQNNSYIYTDFDMSIFDTMGVGTSTSAVLNVNQSTGIGIPSTNMVGTAIASPTDVYLNPFSTIFEGDISHQHPFYNG